MVVSEKPIMMSAVVKSAGQILGLARPRIDEVEGAVDPRLARGQDRIVVGELEPVQDHQPAHAGLQRAVGEMKPVEELREVGMVRRQREPAVAVFRR